MPQDHTLAAVDVDGALAEAIDDLGGGVTRSDLLKKSVKAGGLGLATSGLFGAFASDAFAADPLPSRGKQRQRDLKVLQFGLVAERLGAAFYTEALSKGLTGEAQTYAKLAQRDERAHVVAVQGVIRKLGGTPRKSPRFDFADTTDSAETFLATALEIEEMCVAFLNGGGPVVSTPVLRAAGQLVSVEARQVSYILQIQGKNPVPSAFDPSISYASARSRVKKVGFVTSPLPS